MRAIVAHNAGEPIREIRRALHGAGVDCGSEDCCSWEGLALLLSQQQADVIVVQSRSMNVNWQALTEALSLTRAPMIAVGPRRGDEWEEAARRAGVAEFLSESQLAEGLDGTLDRLVDRGDLRGERGMLISVAAPTAGHGGTTIAMHLAAEMVGLAAERDVALLETTRDWGDVALALNETPAFPVAELCSRAEMLDRHALRRAALLHASGLKLLVQRQGRVEEGTVTPAAVRRLAVLARAAFRATVLALDSSLDAAQLEGMRLADRVVLVVKPEVPGLHRLAWLGQQLEALQVPASRVTLVLNFWGQRGLLTQRQIESVLPWKELPAMVHLPEDAASLNKGLQRGVLLSQLRRHDGICRRLRELATELLKQPAAR